ncbi:DUF4209 domain-containing protein [Nocardiopsis sp. NRRL B-16309]|uniref:DUF4209 domain-containing protein n=1 Tax=Nocardiopsis sp. NRRL B-16309 TaxID=1519494 RepID=UPI0012E2FBEF|nr:DUF4209 domain-containing protein [Nocardiopsis sp. NRRL B-16309]
MQGRELEFCGVPDRIRTVRIEQDKMMTKNSNPSASGSPEEIDRSWLAGIINAVKDTDVVLMSSRFESIAKETESADPKRAILEVLAMVTSPMLVPENWVEPYEPAIQFGGSRTPIPTDLTPDQIALLARLAPLIEHTGLRARVADIAWTYGDRGNHDLLATAIDSYQQSPLEHPSWFHGGRDSWRRAFELALRRGKGEQERVEEMRQAVRSKVLSCEIEDSFLPVQLSELLFQCAKVPPEEARPIADHCLHLAIEAADEKKYRLARSLNRQAASWFGRASEQEAANNCIARVADAYVAEADQRQSGDLSSAMAAGHFLEKAVAVLSSLPRKFRRDAGLEGRLSDLRIRLSDTRLDTLEEMVLIESEGIDLSEYMQRARSAVAGRGRLEALERLGGIHPLTNAGQAISNAVSLSSESIVDQIARRSTYARDGRKVATSSHSGSEGRQESIDVESVIQGAAESDVWSHVVRDFGGRVEVVGKAMILPAQEVILLEHRFDQSFLFDICRESPFVPEGQAGLWARGLLHGLGGDYASASFMLVPQLEQLVRLVLKSRGVYTLLVDKSGVETEKGLSALLEMPEAMEALGAGLVLELRALLCDQQGANLRNNLAHGIATDGEAWSFSAVYAWWLCLRIVIGPVYRMRKAESDSASAGEKEREK